MTGALKTAAERCRQAGERMVALGRRMSAPVVAAAPDLRDVHVYGGGALVAGGMWLSPWPWTALTALGALLLYLGLRRV